MTFRVYIESEFRTENPTLYKMSCIMQPACELFSEYYIIVHTVIQTGLLFVLNLLLRNRLDEQATRNWTGRLILFY